MTNPVVLRWPSIKMSAHASRILRRHINAALVNATPTRVVHHYNSDLLHIQPRPSDEVKFRIAIKKWHELTYDLYRQGNFYPTPETSISFVRDNKVYVNVYPYSETPGDYGYYKFKVSAVHDI